MTLPTPDPKIKLIWMPQAVCQNYSKDQSWGDKCPYCPFGLKDGKVLWEGKVTNVSSKFIPWEELLGFFRTNTEIIGRYLEISGLGEPLIYPHLDKILKALEWTWAITSNTLSRKMIRKLIDVGAMNRCWSWTASYHPLSGDDIIFAENIELLRRNFPQASQIRTTVVVAEQTLPYLERTQEFLQGVDIDGWQYHLDICADRMPNLIEQFHKMLGDEAILLLADTPKQNLNCHIHEQILCVTPDGVLYPCATKASQGLDPIAPITKDLVLADLPPKVEWCSVYCFCSNDHVKHVVPL